MKKKTQTIAEPAADPGPVPRLVARIQALTEALNYYASYAAKAHTYDNGALARSALAADTRAWACYPQEPQLVELEPGQSVQIRPPARKTAELFISCDTMGNAEGWKITLQERPGFPACDGAGPHSRGEARKLPVTPGNPDHGNSILCRACFDRELNERPRTPRPLWGNLEIYPTT